MPSRRNDEGRRRIVVVTGMHRSGTSLVARVINLLGVDLGRDSERIPPAPDNPSGFWESAPIVAFNDELLAALGGSALSPPALRDGWDERPELDGLRERARRLIDASFPDTGLVGWKDPRTSLTLAFWQTCVPVSATILCLRDPLEVARSLALRQGSGEDHAAKLWLRYVVAAHRADPMHLLVRFEEFFAGADGVVDRLAHFLGLPPPSDETRKEIDRFVKPTLRHHRATGQGRTGAMALATFVYELLAATPPVDVAPITESLHDAWLREEDVRQLEHRLGVLGGQHTQARAAEAELRAEAARLQELYDGLHSRISVRVAFALARAAGPLLRSVRGSLPG